MSSWNPFARRQSPLDIEVRKIRDNIIDQAGNQSLQMRLLPDDVDDLIIRELGIQYRRQDPREFTDVVLSLFSFPPELGSVIAVQFNGYENRFRFLPFAFIVGAIAYTRIASKPDFNPQKAGELLSRLLFVDSKTIEEVRKLFLSSTSNSAILTATLQEIRDFASPELVEAILK